MPLCICLSEQRLTCRVGTTAPSRWSKPASLVTQLRECKLAVILRGCCSMLSTRVFTLRIRMTTVFQLSTRRLTRRSNGLTFGCRKMCRQETVLRVWRCEETIFTSPMLTVIPSLLLILTTRQAKKGGLLTEQVRKDGLAPLTAPCAASSSQANTLRPSQSSVRPSSSATAKAQAFRTHL